MKCADVRDLLSAYVDDALDAEQRARLTDHLRDCPACAAELQELKQTIALVQELDEIEPPAEFRTELRQRLRRLAAERQPAGGRRARWLSALPVMSVRSAIAAALVLVITLAGGVGIGYRLQLRAGSEKSELLARGKARDQVATGAAAPPAAPGAGDEGLGGGEPQFAAADQANLLGTAQRAASENTQKIIRNGEMTVAVEEIAPAQRRVEEIAATNGGYVENSSFHQVNATTARASLQLRVPAANLDGVVGAVEQLGYVRTKTIYATDVTAVYTDTDARLKNLQLQEERLREVLKQATTVDDILRVENELSRIRTDIDINAANLRNLQSGVEMGTLTVNLEQDPDAVAVSTNQSLWNRIKGACVNTIKAIGRFLVSLTVFVGGALPVLLILVALWLAIRPQRWFHRQE